MSTRRTRDRAAGSRIDELRAGIEHPDPGIVERREVRPGRCNAALGLGLRQRIDLRLELRSVEDGEAVARRLAMVDELAVYRVVGLAWRADERDVVDRRERRERGIEIGDAGNARHVASTAAVVEEPIDGVRELLVT